MCPWICWKGKKVKKHHDQSAELFLEKQQLQPCNAKIIGVGIFEIKFTVKDAKLIHVPYR